VEQVEQVEQEEFLQGPYQNLLGLLLPWRQAEHQHH
jgi:hypothetical protein